MDRMVVADRLRAIRGEVSQDEFADAIGVSKSSVSMYESGERVPRDEVKIRIAQYANKSVQDIFFNPKVHF